MSLSLACSASPAPSAAAPDRPPVERGEFRAADLVELVTLDPTIHLDVRYATPNNFAKQPVYRQARAFLQRPAAEAVVRAHRALAADGYGIVVFDGYRPWSVTKLFWEIVTPEDRARGFVANPAKGSKHNRGCAVDLSLYVLATGREAEMPSRYDEFSDRASPKYSGGPPELLARRDLLRRRMEAEGFEVDPGEWWHYNYRDWRSYPILDIPFDAIGAPTPSAAAEKGAWLRPS
jgi:D-alanyl-D-alanine dipeptidase